MRICINFSARNTFEFYCTSRYALFTNYICAPFAKAQYGVRTMLADALPDKYQRANLLLRHVAIGLRKRDPDVRTVLVCLLAAHQF